MIFLGYLHLRVLTDDISPRSAALYHPVLVGAVCADWIRRLSCFMDECLTDIYFPILPSRELHCLYWPSIYDLNYYITF